MLPTPRLYPVPAGVTPSVRYTVEVDGQPIFVHDCQVGSFAVFPLSGSSTVRITPMQPAKTLTVRPHHRRLEARPDGDGAFTVTLDRPQNLYIEAGNGLPLYLFANPVEVDRPDPADPSVIFFAAGQVYDAGEIVLGDGQTLYIEGGAVVKGAVAARGAGITVAGYGLLDATGFPMHERYLLVFNQCRDLRVSGIITVGTPCWNLVLGGCDRVLVENVKLIGWAVSSDGIDVVGSRDVVIRDCFLRNNDDCIVIKAMAPDAQHPDWEWQRDVENVLAERCVLYNDRAGNVLEIGHETRTGVIRNITFRDMDVIAGHGEGGVLTIHNGDHATVSDVLYENIRVEHFYDKLIDFRVYRSRYSKDSERGQIRRIHLRDIQTIADQYNTVSLIGGYDADHTVEDVTIENLVMGGTPITHPDQFELYMRNARNITFGTVTPT